MASEKCGERDFAVLAESVGSYLIAGDLELDVGQTDVRRLLISCETLVVG